MIPFHVAPDAANGIEEIAAVWTAEDLLAGVASHMPDQVIAKFEGFGAGGAHKTTFI